MILTVNRMGRDSDSDMNRIGGDSDSDMNKIGRDSDSDMSRMGGNSDNHSIGQKSPEMPTGGELHDIDRCFSTVHWVPLVSHKKEQLRWMLS